MAENGHEVNGSLYQLRERTRDRDREGDTRLEENNKKLLLSLFYSISKRIMSVECRQRGRHTSINRKRGREAINIGR